MDSRLITSAVAACLAVALAPAAEAAPQALGVVASIAPVPLNCHGVECSAQLGAFCLQREREVPAEGARYEAVTPADFTLIATLADGSELRLNDPKLLDFESAFGYASVRVTAPRELLARLGAVQLAVEVAPTAVLIPNPVEGDPDPLSIDEIALAAGPLRQLASSHFDAPSTGRDAAQLVEAMVNGLPGNIWDTPEKRESVWDRQVTPALSGAASPEGLAVARTIFENCLPHSYSMRQCLELKHMNLLSDANRAYWEEASPGS